MQKAELIEALKGLRPSLAAEGVRHLAIFGSRARGDEHPTSDLDLLVDIEPDASFSLLNLVGVEQIVAEGTGLTANAVTRRGLETPLRESIEKDLVTVF